MKKKYYKNCLVCGKKFLKKKNISLVVWKNETKFCSRRCFHLQNKPWLGKKRPGLSEKIKEMCRSGEIKRIGLKNEDHPLWKGEDASYAAMHKWVYLRKKRTYYCEICGDGPKTKTEFANKSGLYKRDENDYMELCCSCHRYLDMGNIDRLPVSKEKVVSMGFSIYG